MFDNSKSIKLGQMVIYSGIKGYVTSVDCNEIGNVTYNVRLYSKGNSDDAIYVSVVKECLVVDTEDTTEGLIEFNTHVVNKDSGDTAVVVNVVRNSSGELVYGVITTNKENIGNYQKWIADKTDLIELEEINK